MVVSSRTALKTLVAALLCLVAFPAANAFANPTNDTPPTVFAIDGTLVGATVTADPGNWSSGNPPVDFTYQWQRCDSAGANCTDIAGETQVDYVLTAADIDSTVGVEVTGTDGDGPTTVAAPDPVGPVAPAPAIVDNGVVQLGINPLGTLGVSSLNSSLGTGGNDGTTMTALRQLSDNAEGVGEGAVEGWGVADAANAVTGYSSHNPLTGSDDGANLKFVSSSATATTATTVTDVTLANNAKIRVTHSFLPSPGSAALYEIDVTIKALADVGDLRYRRVVDWAAQPTSDAEYLTTRQGTSTALAYVSDDGAASVNPLDAPTKHTFAGDAVNTGPSNLGSIYDLHLGALTTGQSKQFKIFYGAAPSESTALSALATAHPEAFSLAKSSNGSSMATGAPATFMIAFSGIGGADLLDPTLPDTTVVTEPSGVGTSTTANFQFSSPAPSATFECSKNGGAWAACPASFVESGLADGEYFYRVRAKVGAKVDLTPAVARWEVDTHPPGVYIISHTMAGDNTHVDLVLGHHTAENGPIHYECKLDNFAWTDCDANVTVPIFSNGFHTVLVRGTDLAGNVDTPGVDATYSWTTGQGPPPNTTITSAGGLVTSSTWTATFTSDQFGATFECALDFAAFTACSSPFDVTGLTNGIHTFKVRAVDSTMQVDATPAQVALEVQLPPAPPAPPGSSPPPKPTFTPAKPKPGAQSIKFAFTCPDTSCSVSGSLKIGKTTFTLTQAKVIGSAGIYTVKFPPAALKAIKKAKKAKKKVSYSVVFTANAGSQTFAGKF